MIAFRPMAVVCLFSAVFAPLALHAQVPAFINFQGRLLNGTNLVNGTVSMDLTLYNSPSGGGFQYVDTGSVVVVDGLYSTVLGDGTALGTLTNALAQTNVYLEVTVNGVTLTPRERLASSAYAIRAARAEIFTGAIQDSQLSTNIARLNGTNQVFGQTVVFNNVSNTFYGAFVGNGAGVTNLQLASLSHPDIFTWGGYFALVDTLSGGLNPYSVATGDVNGDGYKDVIVANVFSNTLSVLTNNGSGVFTISSSPPVGTTPLSVIAADVNADGKLDLISANGSASTLSVLTNNGSGGFTLVASPAVGSTPRSVAAADVNGDSRVDLISANEGPDTLTVLTNNGANGFAVSSSPGVGLNPQFVVAADVNADGRMDLVSANVSSDTLSVLTNNGSGGFTLNASPTVGTAPNSVAAADVNGDGRIDLISANEGPDTLSVLTNNGAGGFALSSSPGVGLNPQFVMAADVSGDGSVDLISANNGSDTLSVLTNNGSGAFSLCSQPAVGDGPRSVAALDINGDGKLDLASANFDDPTLSLHLNAPLVQAVVQGDGSGLYNAAGWTRSRTNIYYNLGNVGIGTTSPTSSLQVAGTITCVTLNQTSDRNVKENFAPVDADDILGKISALPVSRWNFKGEPGVVHLGPMAQDFRAAFQLGQNDVTISTVDADGVALTAIQALYKLVQDQDARLAEQQRRIDELEQQLHAR